MSTLNENVLLFPTLKQIDTAGSAHKGVVVAKVAELPTIKKLDESGAAHKRDIS
jgi:hypothetical protein